jgi:hypothetical protein
MVTHSEASSATPATVVAVPDPETATSPAELTAALRLLKCWSGLSYRDLERRAQRHGTILPRSTLTTALSRDGLPREELVAAFVQACGCDQHQTARWVAVRRRLAIAALGEASLIANRPATTTRMVFVPPSGHGRHGAGGAGRRSVAAQLLPPAWHGGGTLARVLIVTVAAAVLIITAVTARAI